VSLDKPYLKFDAKLLHVEIDLLRETIKERDIVIKALNKKIMRLQMEIREITYQKRIYVDYEKPIDV